MKIVISQLNPKIGAIKENTQKIITETERFKDNADIIVFSELFITGYPPRDLLIRENFIKRCKDSVNDLIEYTKGINCAIIVGTPIKEKDALYNSALFIYKGKILHQKNKTLLPQYDLFDELHYFRYFKENPTFEFKGKKIGILICEDSWFKETSRYEIDPVEELREQNPDIIINIAASPYYIGKQLKRENLFSEIAKRTNSFYIYVNQTGANDDIIFDGHSMAFNPNGSLNTIMEGFIEYSEIIDTEKEKKENFDHLTKEQSVILALVKGTKDYFEKCNIKKAVIGISGGIDSALVAYIAKEAIGSENVLGIAMPSQFSTSHSLKDAKDLCKNLNIELNIITIKELYEEYETKLHPYFKDTEFDVTEENIQARIRGNILMAFSNKFGNMVLTTGNKSEVSVGYCTLYGDMCGGLNPIGDLYKTEVFEICKYINKQKEIIPKNIINKPPSAELRPDQKDSDSLPEYEILDKILKHHIEENLEKEEIIEKGFDEDTVNKILWLVKINEYKRKQAAPILKINKRSYGQGWRMPIAKK